MLEVSFNGKLLVAIAHLVGQMGPPVGVIVGEVRLTLLRVTPDAVLLGGRTTDTTISQLPEVTLCLGNDGTLLLVGKCCGATAEAMSVAICVQTVGVTRAAVVTA